MADLGAIHEDVAFDWGKASELSGEMRSTANVLEWQVGERESIRSAARTVWRGRYGDEFDHRVSLCKGDAGRFVTSLRTAADGLDELARLAQEEQDRRQWAREWEAAQEDDGGGGWGIPIVDDVVEAGGDLLDSGHDLLFGDDDEVPPPPPPVEPPTIPIGDPGTVVRDAPPATPVPVFGSGGVSSAKPDDLDDWVTTSLEFDEAVTVKKGSLDELHSEFRATLGWGEFDASSLFGAIGTWLTWNGTDGLWVATIAQTFRDAGAGTVPDAVIDARLDAAGLDTMRTSVTYDEPSLWGDFPTSGYADDPVNTASGNFVETEVDLDASGLCRLLRFTRTYNSRSDRIGPFGRGWASWVSCRLRAEPDGAHWVAPDGQEVVIPRGEGVSYARVAGVAGLVVREGDGLAIEGFDGSRAWFDRAGLPTSMERGPGTRVEFAYDDGRLVRMSHAGGKSVSFAWDGERIVGMRCSDGRAVRYRYDDAANLIDVEVGVGAQGRRRYELDDRGRVVTVVDADGVVEVRNSYDDEGRVVAQRSPHGRRSRFRYLPGRVTVVDDDAAGPVNSYVHDDHGRLVGAVDGHGNELKKTYDRWGNPIRVTERDGSVTVQDWDERSRLVRRQGPDGSWLAVAYDDVDRVVEVATSGDVVRYRYEGDERIPVEVVDAEGGVTRLEVDGGLVRALVDPDDVAVSFAYDTNGELIAVADALGNSMVLERDRAGHVTATVSPSGLRTELTYDEAGRLAEHRDPAGGARRFDRSPAGRLLAVADPTGGRRELRYGTNGEAEQLVDELGHVTTRRFDTLANLAGVVLPDGAKWEFGYDRLCRLTSTNDPAGATWLREYDVAGRPIGTIDPAGVHRAITYDQAGRILGLHDGLTSIAFERDLAGRVVALRRPDGSEITATYDRCGRMTSTTDPEGGVRRFDYTAAGRLAAVTSPLGHMTRFEHDRCGRRSAVIDPSGHRWEYRYDTDGRITDVVMPTGETTRFRYDVAGRLAERVSSAGGITRYGYDAAGRLVTTTDPAGGVTRFVWDPRGLLAEAVDANGNVTRYELDERGLLRTVVDPLGGRTEQLYDPVGRMVERRDQLARTTQWAYDPAGRLVRKKLPTGERRRWWRDPSGRVRGVGTNDDDGPIVEIERDLLGRLVVVTEPRFRHDLAWDKLGRLVAKTRNGLGLTWRYDPDGRRVAVGYPDGTETRYDHDPAGRVVSASHPAAGTVSFEHDGAGRLVVRRSAGAAQRWRYVDGLLVAYEVERRGTAGRMTELGRDAAGRVVAATTDGARTTDEYDPAGQLVAATGPEGAWAFRYDTAGRLVAELHPDGLDVAYRYDTAHQLVERRSGDSVIRFAHDAAGRRTREDRPDGTTRSYSWDWRGRLAGAGDVALRVDALGDLAEVDGLTLLWDSVGAVRQLRWLDGTNILGDHEPWASVDPSGGIAWFDRDWQGTVGSADSDPWGGLVDSPAASQVGLGYRGELCVDGLVWLRNRAYDPATRGFLSKDPLPGVPGTAFAANGYHYAGNDPIGALDPFGLRPITEAELEAYREAAANSGLFDRAGDVLDTAGDWLETGGRYVLGGSMVVIGFAGAFNPLGSLAQVLPEPLRPLVALGSPLHLATGTAQTGLAFVMGEHDLDDLSRHLVNGPSTTVGQGLAIMGDGDLSYNDEHGIWTAEGAADWTTGRGGTTYGSVFVTPDTSAEIDAAFARGERCGGWDDLLGHEATHSDQYARYGGGIGFPIAYIVEEITSGGGANNKFEQEADLEDGGYVNPPHCT